MSHEPSFFNDSHKRSGSMYDPDIRRVIKAAKPQLRLVDEVNMKGGKARIDLLDITTTLEGWEIKSDNDSFARLGNQIAVYGKCLPLCNICTGEHFSEVIGALVPGWWGIYVCSKDPTGSEYLEQTRAGTANPDIDIKSTLELLWKNELVDLISAKTHRRIWTTKWKLILNVRDLYSKKELPELIAAKLRARTDWRL